MSSQESRLDRLEQSLPEGPDTPCILFGCKASGVDYEANKAAAVSAWEGSTGRKIDPNNVRFVCWRIFESVSDVEQYGR